MAGWPRVEAVPGIRQALRALRPHAVIGLATNAADSEPGEIRAALGRVRLAASFGKIYCYRALGVRKPSPEYFAAVLADLGLAPGRVVLVGDDWRADVEGALAAGLWAVWYNPRHGEARCGARVGTVHEMAAVMGLLQGWGLIPR
jgi:putative hydrolase of the HAD superfamily